MTTKTIFQKLLPLLWLCCSLCAVISHAAITVYEFDDDTQEVRYRALIEELRCPKCQNQNLAGSDAPIAQDLKQKTYELIKTGKSDDEIRDYMVERYGEFITYNPPVRPSTWILWVFPPCLLVFLLIGWFWHTNKKTKGLGTSVNTDLSAYEKDELAKLLDDYQTKDKP